MGWIFVLLFAILVYTYFHFEFKGDTRPFLYTALALFIYLGIWFVVIINNNDIPLWRTP